MSDGTLVEQRYVCTECFRPHYLHVKAERRKERITTTCPDCGEETEQRPKGSTRWF